MPRYDVDLVVNIHVTVTINADDMQQATKNWASCGYALQEAKMAVAEEARCLDDYEFDVEDVQELEEDEV